MSNFNKTDPGREFTVGLPALKRPAQSGDIGPAVALLASTTLIGSAAIPCEFTPARSSDPANKEVSK
jgi:hypothetical protein